MTKPLRHIPINTVLGQYFCETIVMIPVLEQCSMSTNSDFIIFAQDLMQDHAKVKMEVELEGTHNGGQKIKKIRIKFLTQHDFEITFEWSNRVLIADGAGLIDALERHKRQMASQRQTSDKITKLLDGMISAHLLRNPEQLNNLKGDPEIQRIKYFERYPEAGSAFTATSSTTPLNKTHERFGE